MPGCRAVDAQYELKLILICAEVFAVVRPMRVAQRRGQPDPVERDLHAATCGDACLPPVLSRAERRSALDERLQSPPGHLVSAKHRELPSELRAGMDTRERHTRRAVGIEAEHGANGLCRANRPMQRLDFD